MRLTLINDVVRDTFKHFCRSWRTCRRITMKRSAGMICYNILFPIEHVRSKKKYNTHAYFIHKPFQGVRTSVTNKRPSLVIDSILIYRSMLIWLLIWLSKIAPSASIICQSLRADFARGYANTLIDRLIIQNNCGDLNCILRSGKLGDGEPCDRSSSIDRRL